MVKLAVFVEGYTEVLFVKRLVAEVAGANNVLIEYRIIEEYGNLDRDGYRMVIGMRDVPRFTPADIPELERNLPKYVKSSPIPVVFVLAVMEVEAWFLAESSHFPRIDPVITVEAIRATLGFDPALEDMQSRPEPARDLADCYAIAGQTYQKALAGRTVMALDSAAVYQHLPNRFPHLQLLVTSLDRFLSE